MRFESIICEIPIKEALRLARPLALISGITWATKRRKQCGRAFFMGMA
jgi:hypothetical protein